MMKKCIFFIGLSLNVISQVKAQYYYDRSKNPDRTIQQKNTQSTTTTQDFNRFFYLLWDNNVPTSNSTFINKPSSLGLKAGFRKRLNNVDKLWVGGELGWAVYNQYHPLTAYQYNGSAISTDLYNYSYNYNLTVNLDYFFSPMEKLIVPYAGLGIGVAATKFAQYYNVYGGSTTAWGLQVRPELGLLVGFKQNSTWRVKASAHFDYASNNSNLVNASFVTPGNNNYNNFINYGFQIGLVKMAW